MCSGVLQPTAEERAWVLGSGARYWPSGSSHVAALPIPSCAGGTPGRAWREVPLPEWAADLGVGGRGTLLVDAAAIADGEGPPWSRCDWIAAAWSHLSGAAERAHEHAHGPAGSYAWRLEGVEPALFDRAWVNRIFLFLRRWASRAGEADEDRQSGPLPEPCIALTHDVDAVRKTPEIRLKQSVFHLFNAGRRAAKGNLSGAGEGVRAAGRFALGGADFWTFDEVRRLEERASVRSTIHFYAGAHGRHRPGLSGKLIDPAYDVGAPALREEIRAFEDGGWSVGLHQSTRAWRDAGAMRDERSRLEAVSAAPVRRCRQHWLRFSWAETWRAQAAAGLDRDSTLGFNDRPGFRNGAALAFRPFDPRAGRSMSLEAVPMVFMDSHFYDYALLDEEQRADAMARWLDEVRAVKGEASVNWHTHTMSDAYGWGGGYRQLLSLLS